MNRNKDNTLSMLCFGVFIAPMLSLIWFVVPGLRDFPVRNDSPHSVALPLGFVLGVYLAWLLNRNFRWGRVGTIFGTFLCIVVLAYTAYCIWMMNQVEGFDGLGWLIKIVICFHGVVSACGLLLSGFFAQRAQKARISW